MSSAEMDAFEAWLHGRDTRGWFLASGGADAADPLGGMSVHHEMKRSQRLIGIGVGLWGATRRTTGAGEIPARLGKAPDQRAAVSTSDQELRSRSASSLDVIAPKAAASRANRAGASGSASGPSSRKQLGAREPNSRARRYG